MLVHSNQDRRSGFTFLELLVALAILGAAFTLLLAAHMSALRQESRARRLMTATLLAQEILADTEINGAPELGSDSGDFGDEFPGYAWRRRVEATEFEQVQLVLIEVSWPDRGGTDTAEIEYYNMSEGSP